MFSRYLVILIFVFNLVGYGCSHPSSAKLQTPVKFSSIEKIQVKTDTSQSYSLYLPTGYNSTKSWPVILLFDPHRDGALAVEKFKVAAETFGYVLAGSDNAGNGVENTNQIAENMLDDLSQRYSIDPKRIYAGGFSGGARIAVAEALNSGKIKGIITCSAGLGRFDPSYSQSKTDVYGIAGLEDFNYREVIEIPEQLQNSGWRNAIELFDGSHAWPPQASIFNSVLWHELNAMKDGMIPKDKALLQSWSDSMKTSLERLISENRYLQAERKAESAVSFLNGLSGTSALEDLLSKIREMPGYKKEQERDANIRYQESELQKAYSEGFETQNIAWWNNELKALNEEIANNKDVLYHQMYSRIKGFLGIAAYSFVSNALGGNDLPRAEKYLAVYQAVEPANADCFFYKAVLLDRQGKTGEAVTALRKSLELEFSDKQKIKSSFSAKVLNEAGIQ